MLIQPIQPYPFPGTAIFIYVGSKEQPDISSFRAKKVEIATHFLASFAALREMLLLFCYDYSGILMNILLNGEKKDVPAGLRVKGLLEHLDIKPERVAVEINEEIVRKATYAETAVNEGDRVEVVQFMGGG